MLCAFFSDVKCSFCGCHLLDLRMLCVFAENLVTHPHQGFNQPFGSLIDIFIILFSDYHLIVMILSIWLNSGKCTLAKRPPHFVRLLSDKNALLWSMIIPCIVFLLLLLLWYPLINHMSVIHLKVVAAGILWGRINDAHIKGELNLYQNFWLSHKRPC